MTECSPNLLNSPSWANAHHGVLCHANPESELSWLESLKNWLFRLLYKAAKPKPLKYCWVHDGVVWQIEEYAPYR